MSGGGFLSKARGLFVSQAGAKRRFTADWERFAADRGLRVLEVADETPLLPGSAVATNMIGCSGGRLSEWSFGKSASLLGGTLPCGVDATLSRVYMQRQGDDSDEFFVTVRAELPGSAEYLPRLMCRGKACGYPPVWIDGPMTDFFEAGGAKIRLESTQLLERYKLIVPRGERDATFIRRLFSPTFIEALMQMPAKLTFEAFDGTLATAATPYAWFSDYAGLEELWAAASLFVARVRDECAEQQT